MCRVCYFICFLFFFTIRLYILLFFFFSSRRRHTRCLSDWFRRVLFRSADAARAGRQLLAGRRRLLLARVPAIAVDHRRLDRGLPAGAAPRRDRLLADPPPDGPPLPVRSEERRVGRESSRGS